MDALLAQAFGPDVSVLGRVVALITIAAVVIFVAMATPSTWRKPAVADGVLNRAFWVDPSPYRIPYAVLIATAILIGVGLPILGLWLDVVVAGLEPMMVLLVGSLLIGACASIAGNYVGHARALLYSATAGMLVLAGWIAFDNVQDAREQRRAEAQFAADLNALCREDGGQNLTDPACARYARVFDNYHYPDGVPADVEALRAGDIP